MKFLNVVWSHLFHRSPSTLSISSVNQHKHTRWKTFGENNMYSVLSNQIFEHVRRKVNVSFFNMANEKRRKNMSSKYDVLRQRMCLLCWMIAVYARNAVHNFVSSLMVVISSLVVANPNIYRRADMFGSVWFTELSSEMRTGMEFAVLHHHYLLFFNHRCACARFLMYNTCYRTNWSPIENFSHIRRWYFRVCWFLAFFVHRI